MQETTTLTIEERLTMMHSMLEQMLQIMTTFQEMAQKIEEGIAQSPMASMLGMRH